MQTQRKVSLTNIHFALSQEVISLNILPLIEAFKVPCTVTRLHNPKSNLCKIRVYMHQPSQALATSLTKLANSFNNA